MTPDNAPQSDNAARTEELLQRFFEKSITELEADELLGLWKRLPELETAAFQDYYREQNLRFLFTLRREPFSFEIDRKEFLSLAFEPTLKPASFIDFDRLVTLAKEAPSLPSSPSLSIRRKIETPKPVTRTVRLPRFLQPVPLLSAFCLFLILGIVYFVLRDDMVRKIAMPRQPSPVAVPARLEESVRAKWDGGDRFFPKGAPFESGWLRLTEGLASFRLLNGASMLVIGPTEFAVDEQGDVLCKSGRLNLDVPPQPKPLRIGLPQCTVVVRGTRFSVEASPLGSEVHLFEGVVEIEHGTKADPAVETVQPGESILLTATGELRRMAVDKTKELPEEDVRQQFRAEEEDARRQRRKIAHSLRNDNSVLWNLEVEKENLNHLAWTTGREPDTRTIAFQDVSGDITIELPDRQLNLTMAAWVRIDHLSDYSNMLLKSLSGEISWQITPRGNMELLILGRRQREKIEVFKKFRLGSWTHLAVVVDGINGTIRYYVDGNEIAREEVALGPFRIGPARIAVGAPNRRENKQQDRDGGIEEMLIFNRALSKEEIVDLVR